MYYRPPTCSHLLDDLLSELSRKKGTILNRVVAHFAFGRFNHEDVLGGLFLLVFLPCTKAARRTSRASRSLEVKVEVEVRSVTSQGSTGIW